MINASFWISFLLPAWMNLWPQRELTFKQEDKHPLEATYESLTEEERWNLVLVSQENYPARARSVQDSIWLKNISFVNSALVHKFQQRWARSQPNDFIYSSALSATNWEEPEFLHYNPFERAKRVDRLMKHYAQAGKILVHHQFWKDFGGTLSKEDFRVKVMTALRQLRDEEHSIWDLTELPENPEALAYFLSYRAEWGFDGLMQLEISDTVALEKQWAWTSDAIQRLVIPNSSRSDFVVWIKRHQKDWKKWLKNNGLKNLELNQSQPTEPLAEPISYPQQFDFQLTNNAIIVLRNQGNLLPLSQQKDASFEMVSADPRLNDLSASFQPNGGRKQWKIIDGFSKTWDTLRNSGSANSVLLIDKQTFSRNRFQEWEGFEAIVVSPDTSFLSKSLAFQSIFRAVGAHSNWPEFSRDTESKDQLRDWTPSGRLRYVQPEWVGLATVFLDSIDARLQQSIQQKVFPGCQVAFAWKGDVVYSRNLGHLTYDRKTAVAPGTLYDIASITKIAASTLGLMVLEDQGKFDLSKTLGDYLSDSLMPDRFAQIRLKDMMAHQAGLPAWIPFYERFTFQKKTIPTWFSTMNSVPFTSTVAHQLFVRKEIEDSLYKIIYQQRLGEPKYLYSDLGYYFVKKIIEQQSQQPLNEFLLPLHRSLGMSSTGYNPWQWYPVHRIAPTENDQYFRQQLIQGYVHDPGAALMGGIGGHAGLFSNSSDLMVLMQMWMNGGEYAGRRLLSKQVVDRYTSVQFPGKNRRGAGFDKPTQSGKGGTACELATPSSFGHSGFTGTLVWADPKAQINYVFLSNRVYPDANNWKITQYNIRTDIQAHFYRCVSANKQINYIHAN